MSCTRPGDAEDDPIPEGQGHSTGTAFTSTVRDERFFYLSALITVVWIGQFCRTCSNDFNCEGLGTEVDFSLPSESVVHALNQIIS